MRLYSEFLLPNVYIWIKKTLKTIQKFLSAESWKKGYIKMFKKYQKAPTSLPFVSNSVTWQPWNLTRSWFEVETLSRKGRQSKPLWSTEQWHFWARIPETTKRQRTEWVNPFLMFSDREKLRRVPNSTLDFFCRFATIMFDLKNNCHNLWRVFIKESNRNCDNYFRWCKLWFKWLEDAN